MTSGTSSMTRTRWRLLSLTTVSRMSLTFSERYASTISDRGRATSNDHLALLNGDGPAHANATGTAVDVAVIGERAGLREGVFEALTGAQDAAVESIVVGGNRVWVRAGAIPGDGGADRHAEVF